MTTRVDLKKEWRALYHAEADAAVEIEVPPLRYLMVDGEGEDETAADFAAAADTLLAVSHAARERRRQQGLQPDYIVMPLQALWWTEDRAASEDDEGTRRRWTAMVLQPDFVGDEILAAAVNEVRRRRRHASLDELRIQELGEGRCAQVLHVGPLADRQASLLRLHAFIDGRGRARGRHHEIYLSDMRRTEPVHWRTLLRRPLG